MTATQLLPDKLNIFSTSSKEASILLRIQSQIWTKAKDGARGFPQFIKLTPSLILERPPQGPL